MESDQKSRGHKRNWFKYVKRIGIIVACVSVLITVGMWFMNRNPGAKLVEVQQKLDASITQNKTPTPSEFAKAIPEVLKRASDVRDFTAELNSIKLLTSQFDERFGTSSQSSIENYLGRYKVVIRIGIVEDVDCQVIRDGALEVYGPILDYNKEFTRLEFNVISGNTCLERYYLSNSSQQKLVFDNKFWEDLASTEPNEKVLKVFYKLASNEFLTNDIRVEGYATEEYDAVQVYINIDGDVDGTGTCIDYIDLAFQKINSELSNPVYLRVYESEDSSQLLVFSGLIIPNAKEFKGFYTAKPYYQDISRAEYYLCNNWLYAGVLTSISGYLENLI